MSINQNARLAGLLYFIVVITGIVSLAYVPSQLIVWDNPALTVENIKTSEFLFRVGIFSGVLCYLAFLILPFALFKLFEKTNREVALFMVILAVISVPISIFNLIGKLDVLTVINNTALLEVYSPQQISAQVMTMLRSYNNGITIVQVFWGLWLFPFGYLVFKSALIPRVFGILLMLGCISYLIRFTGATLLPELDIPSFVRLPASIAEIGTCLWLLIMGAKDPSIDKLKSV